MAEPDIIIEFVWKGRTITIRRGELNALDERDFRRELDVSPMYVFANWGQAMGADMIAGLIWLKERKLNPNLTYAEVAAEVPSLDSSVWGPDDEPAADEGAITEGEG